MYTEEDLDAAYDDLDRLQTEQKRAEDAGDSSKAEALEDPIEFAHHKIAEIEIAIGESC